jgi:hypothetical protein
MNWNFDTGQAGLALRCEPSVWSYAFTRFGPAEGGTPNVAYGVTRTTFVIAVFGIRETNPCCKLPGVLSHWESMQALKAKERILPNEPILNGNRDNAGVSLLTSRLQKFYAIK